MKKIFYLTFAVAFATMFMSCGCNQTNNADTNTVNDSVYVDTLAEDIEIVEVDTVDGFVVWVDD